MKIIKVKIQSTKAFLKFTGKTDVWNICPAVDKFYKWYGISEESAQHESE